MVTNNVKITPCHNFAVTKFHFSHQVTLPLYHQRNPRREQRKEKKKMISQDFRDELMRRTEAERGNGIYQLAATIYQTIYGKPIAPKYIYRFLNGTRKVLGKTPKHHQPLDIVRAVRLALEQQKQLSEKMTQEAYLIMEGIAA